MNLKEKLLIVLSKLVEGRNSNLTFPPFEIFKNAFDTKFKGKFQWNLNEQDAFSAGRLGFQPKEKWVDPKQLYDDLKKMSSKGDRRLKDQAEYILHNLGF